MSECGRKYTGGSGVFRAGIGVFAAVWLSVSAAHGAGAAPATGTWRAAPAYLALFTQAATHPDAYETYTSLQSIEAVLRELAADTSLLRPPGAWTAQRTAALDAFGRNGTYNRWTLARLYGATRAGVARGPRGSSTRVTESWTLISPYPDPSLSRLEPGTLLIVLRLP